MLSRCIKHTWQRRCIRHCGIELQSFTSAAIRFWRMWSYWEQLYTRHRIFKSRRYYPGSTRLFYVRDVLPMLLLDDRETSRTGPPMHRRFVWKNDRRWMHRRCIAKYSGKHPQTLLKKIISRSIPETSAMHRRNIRDASGMHPRIFIKHILGICILRSLAVHNCVDTRIEKTCQLLHRRCLFPSGTIT